MSLKTGYALSSDNLIDYLRGILGKEPRVCVVDEKFSYFDIDFIFGDDDYCILILGNKNRIGRWTLVSRHNDTIEFFDPGKNYSYNTVQLQSKRTNNCGRFVIFRVMTLKTMIVSVLGVDF